MQHYRHSDATRTTALNLLTLNLGLLALRPSNLAGISFAPHVDERLAAAPDHLQAAEADVVALQEVYSSSHRRFLQKSLFKTYPYVSAPRSLRSVLGSGLMFLSRHPIISAEFVPWHGAPLIENAVSAKGCLCITLKVAGFGLLRLLNLHLSVGGALRRPVKADNNDNQLAEIDQVLAIARTSDSVPAILVGDFNCSPIISPEVYERIIEAGFSDAFYRVATRQQRSEAVTWDQTNPLNAGGRYRNSPSQRIDHVFLPLSLRERVVPISSAIEFSKPTVLVGAARAVTLSDHYGLSVRLALKAKIDSIAYTQPRFSAHTKEELADL